MILTYGRLRLEEPDSYVYYAKFVTGEYDFLNVRRDNIVLNATY
mgnify:CR=1 FL=1